MPNHSTIVTSYTDPDLDGTACLIAYAEFLNKTGRSVLPAVFGTPHREAQFVLNNYSVSIPRQDATVKDDLIIVDASDLYGLPVGCKPEQVIEIIDHRAVNRTSLFPNARVQIELIGAAATLIAEKFYNENIEISPESAGLLNSAIISNTVNFRANVTTDRDRKMHDWLTKFAPITPEYIRAMFKAKSNITAKNLEAAILSDLSIIDREDKRFGVAQLEILDATTFVDGHKETILDVLKKIQQAKSLQYIFMTVIDIDNGRNIVIASDDKIKDALQAGIGVKFNENIAYHEGIMMRKTITPKIIDLL